MPGKPEIRIEDAMEIQATAIPDVLLITPARHGDHRGFLSETYSRRALAEAGIDVAFVQDNHSLSAAAGTVRGLHYQLPPMAQAKLIRVARGAIFDVAVDLRRNSPTFGRHVGAMLSAEAWNQIFIPPGFAHGFCTLAPDTEVLYRLSNYYAPAHEHGLRWDDEALAIAWPVSHEQAILSDRDRRNPRLAELTALF
jgi:dTDP-4-dehydrorhamnose 3,5-epimerase